MMFGFPEMDLGIIIKYFEPFTEEKFLQLAVGISSLALVAGITCLVCSLKGRNIQVLQPEDPALRNITQRFNNATES